METRAASLPNGESQNLAQEKITCLGKSCSVTGQQGQSKIKTAWKVECLCFGPSPPPNREDI